MKLKYIGKDGASGLRYGEVYSVQIHHLGYSVWLVVSISGQVGAVAIKYGALKDLMSDWEGLN